MWVEPKGVEIRMSQREKVGDVESETEVSISGLDAAIKPEDAAIHVESVSKAIYGMPCRGCGSGHPS